MKLTTEQLMKMIREVLSESDDFDMGAHVHHKRMGRMRRGEADPRNLPAGDPDEGTYVDDPREEQNLKRQEEELANLFGASEAAKIMDKIRAAKAAMRGNREQ